MLLLFNEIVLPWYRQIIYRGVDIEGKWEEKSSYGNGNTQVKTIEIKQLAHDVSGSATMVKSKNEQIVRTEIMYIKGTIKDRLFNGTLIPADKKRLGSSVWLLEVIGDGSRMRGATSWYDCNAAAIVSKNTEWKRI